eukprot:7185650-Pyramimonas_sp.AAC.1
MVEVAQLPGVTNEPRVGHLKRSNSLFQRGQEDNILRWLASATHGSHWRCDPCAENFGAPARRSSRPVDRGQGHYDKEQQRACRGEYRS